MDFILLPFVLVYRGVVTILLLPYYLVKGIINLFTPKKKENKNQRVISEIKKGTPVVIVKETKNIISDNKVTVSDDSKDKRIKNYEKMMAKQKLEEEKRIKEQEQKRIAYEKKLKIEEEKKHAAAEKKRISELDREVKESQKKKRKGSFKKKLDVWWNNLSFNKQRQMQLEIKKDILLKEFNKQETTRFERPLTFNYYAKTSNGVLERGKIEALSRVDVQSFLMAEGYEVYEITAATGMNIQLFNMFKFKKSRLIFYLSQLSAYLKSGIALAEAVKFLYNQSIKKKEKDAWWAVYYDLSMGDVLSQAMEKRGETFPRFLINMIKTAEMTGDLTETLDSMVEYYTEADKTRKQMISAITYPSIVLVFASAVITFILIWVVPQFVDIYKDLDAELPAITKLVINISEFLKNYFIVIIAGFAIFVVLMIFLYKNVKEFRMSLQKTAMHLPVFGNIIIYNEVTIFTKTFANLINHNVFITDSMEVLSKITNNEVYKALIFDTAKNLTKGEPISSAFKDHWAFPAIAYQMLLTGEKTGRLGSMMERVSDYYQEQHRVIINQMKTFIEPVLIVSLAVIVGFILLAVIIPMYSMYDAF